MSGPALVVLPVGSAWGQVFLMLPRPAGRALLQGLMQSTGELLRPGQGWVSGTRRHAGGLLGAEGPYPAGHDRDRIHLPWWLVSLRQQAGSVPPHGNMELAAGLSWGPAPMSDWMLGQLGRRSSRPGLIRA